MSGLPVKTGIVAPARIGMTPPWDLRLGDDGNRRMVRGEFVCTGCGVSFCAITRPSKIRSFCSRSCSTRATAVGRAYPTGPDHHAWAGDAVSVKGGRKRALRAYPIVGPCTRCGATKAERHHKDENTANNEPSNIAILCRRCHMETDGRMTKAAEKMRAIQPLGVAARWG